MNVRFTEQADADIVESYLYGLLHFGEAQADRYEESLRHVIGLIADNPRLAAERPEYRPTVRIHHYGKHYIIYRIEDDCILIVRLLRDNVDLTRHLHSD